MTDSIEYKNRSYFPNTGDPTLFYLDYDNKRMYVWKDGEYVQRDYTNVWIYDTIEQFPETGDYGIIYQAGDNIFRVWNGSGYSELSSLLYEYAEMLLIEKLDSDMKIYNFRSDFPETGESAFFYLDSTAHKTYIWKSNQYKEFTADNIKKYKSTSAFPATGSYGNVYVASIINRYLSYDAFPAYHSDTDRYFGDPDQYYYAKDKDKFYQWNTSSKKYVEVDGKRIRNRIMTWNGTKYVNASDLLIVCVARVQEDIVGESLDNADHQNTTMSEQEAEKSFDYSRYGPSENFPATGKKNYFYGRCKDTAKSELEWVYYWNDSSYVKCPDLLEFSSKSAFPATGERGSLYQGGANENVYHWDGSSAGYVKASVVLNTAAIAMHMNKRERDTDVIESNLDQCYGNDHVSFSERSLFPATGDSKIFYVLTTTNVEDYPTRNDFPNPGQGSIVYIAENVNSDESANPKYYYWNGSGYTERERLGDESPSIFYWNGSQYVQCEEPLTYSSKSAFPGSGSNGCFYIDETDQMAYIWKDGNYQQVSVGLSTIVSSIRSKNDAKATIHDPIKGKVDALEVSQRDFGNTVYAAEAESANTSKETDDNIKETFDESVVKGSAKVYTKKQVATIAEEGQCVFLEDKSSPKAFSWRLITDTKEVDNRIRYTLTLKPVVHSYGNRDSFPASGETGVYYVVVGKRTFYKWDKNSDQYVEITEAAAQDYQVEQVYDLRSDFPTFQHENLGKNTKTVYIAQAIDRYYTWNGSSYISASADDVETRATNVKRYADTYKTEWRCWNARPDDTIYANNPW